MMNSTTITADASTFTEPRSAQALASARIFVDLVRKLELGFARRGGTVPKPAEREAARETYWTLVRDIASALAQAPVETARNLIEELRRTVGPSVWRSRFYRHSFSRPHGYAGDYRMIERIYDLESDGWIDETLPGIVNLMEDLFVSHASVEAVWERRHRLADILRHELGSGRYSTERPLRLLDVACGGSRYLRDVLEEFGAETIEITIVDQDPAALAYVRKKALARWIDRVTINRTRISKLTRIDHGQRFDLIFSAGLFDYLNARSGQALLSHLSSCLRPKGRLVISNFRTGDLCHVSQHVFGAWDLVTRTRTELAELFPAQLEVEISPSGNGSLLFAEARPR